MHEVSLCESMLKILQESAQVKGFTHIKTVWLEVGSLSGVELDAMQFCFDVVMRDTLAEGATLEIIEIPGEAWCPQCEERVPIKQRFDACPECGSYPLEVSAGTEMRVKELEVE